MNKKELQDKLEEHQDIALCMASTSETIMLKLQDLLYFDHITRDEHDEILRLAKSIFFHAQDLVEGE